jgi:hypothetical protein
MADFASIVLSVDVPSRSNPALMYNVKVFRDGTKWCTCPAFKFQKGDPKIRNCKHSRSLEVR